ncbi:MAG: hypothetical protein EHM30_04630 [Desulfobacteraceae bacterium]|nr:MAG: hypothetical protein EHM30_04630 [Desulfobacteraceae bacterium]
MNKGKEYNLALKRSADLLSQRKEIITLSSEKALDRILEAKHPAALIHSFPEQDFYFLVHDIGLNDSYELLALASDKQWDYILDVELWEKDRIDTGSLTRWLDILFQAAPDRFIKWAIEKKSDLIEYYLYHNIRVAIREHDQDPSTFGKDFVTIDDIFYIKVLDHPEYEAPELEAETEEERPGKAQREEFIIKMLEKIAEHDHKKYQQILFESSSVLPAEMEEEFYRIRNVRLAEKGFLPFHEAAAVYSPLKPETLVRRKKISKKKDEYVSLMPVPLYPYGMLKQDNLFAMSLKRISAGEVLQNLQVEFAALCNRIIAADQKSIKSRDELKEVVRKACGYLSIGLERLLKAGEKADTGHTAAMIEQYYVAHIFRTGFGAALELKERAGKWLKRSWFRGHELPISFWGEEWMGALGGLLIKKPLYFDNYKTGHLYRDYIFLSDVTEISKILEEIIALDDLLSVIGTDTKHIKNRSINFKNLLLTLFARYRLGLPKEPFPLPYEDFTRFFATLWTGKGKSRRIDLSIKESFLSWLTEITGLSASEITEKLGRVFDDLFGEIESELKKVSQHDLDSRYISLFLIERKL